MEQVLLQPPVLGLILVLRQPHRALAPLGPVVVILGLTKNIINLKKYISALLLQLPLHISITKNYKRKSDKSYFYIDTFNFGDLIMVV